MDLLKQEDVERNSQVIAVGYGQQYEGDKRGERPLIFTRLKIFKWIEFDLNLTIYTEDTYSAICAGRS